MCTSRFELWAETHQSVRGEGSETQHLDNDSARVETHSLAENEFLVGSEYFISYVHAHQGLNCGQKLIKVSEV